MLAPKKECPLCYKIAKSYVVQNSLYKSLEEITTELNDILFNSTLDKEKKDTGINHLLQKYFPHGTKWKRLQIAIKEAGFKYLKFEESHRINFNNKFEKKKFEKFLSDYFNVPYDTDKN